MSIFSSHSSRIHGHTFASTISLSRVSEHHLRFIESSGKASCDILKYPCVPSLNISSFPTPESFGGSKDQRTPASSLNLWIAISLANGSRARGTTRAAFRCTGCFIPPYDMVRAIIGEVVGDGGVNGFRKAKSRSHIVTDVKKKNQCRAYLVTRVVQVQLI